MATFTFNADSAEVTGTSGVSKVGTTYQMTGTSGQIDIIADAGLGMAFDHTTALETVTGNKEYLSNASPTAISDGEFAVDYQIEYGFDTDLATTGGSALTSWLAQNSNVTNQRVALDLGSSKLVSGFRVSNLSESGGTTNAGIRNIKVYMSDNVADYNATYGANTALTLGFDNEVAEHEAVDTTDWNEYEFTSSISGRYVVIDIADGWGNATFLGFRRIEIEEEGTSPSIDYDYTDDSGATNYVNAGNISALQGVSNTNHRNENFRLNITGVAGDLWNSFIIDNYNVDVTPPDDPTGAKTVDAEVWGMWWVQSPEGNTIKAQLKRIIDGTTTYLANSASLPVWQEATPTTWWTFARDNTGADTPFNAYDTDDVAGTSIVYYVRFIDASDNASAWVAFTESAGGFTPATPTLNSLSVADGSVTIDVTPNAESDEVYARVRRNSPAYTWESKSESFKRTGSGTITITGLTNGIEYELAAQTLDGGINGTGSDFAGSRFAVPDSDEFATCRASTKLNLRNGMAQRTLDVCKRLGVKIEFRNDGVGTSGDTVYAVVDQAQTQMLGPRSSGLGTRTVVLQVPRQTNFPPSDFKQNCTLVYNGNEYNVDDEMGDNEDINYASSWMLTCSVIANMPGM